MFLLKVPKKSDVLTCSSCASTIGFDLSRKEKKEDRLGVHRSIDFA
jgi:hypothetical protein